MADRPILFSGPMVRSLLDGRKTQTRRVLKVRRGLHPPCADDTADVLLPLAAYRVGDRLWVRETWENSIGSPDEVSYRATAVDDGWRPEEVGEHKWRPSIFMPRWASRLTLTVTRVRVQRLQDISPADAIAEGIAPTATIHTIDCDTPNPCYDYRSLWDSLNAKRGFGWETNPWVVALTFTVARQNIDAEQTEAA